MAEKNGPTNLEKEQIFGMAEKEMEYRVELLTSCFEKCIEKRYKKSKKGQPEEVEKFKEEMRKMREEMSRLKTLLSDTFLNSQVVAGNTNLIDARKS